MLVFSFNIHVLPFLLGPLSFSHWLGDHPQPDSDKAVVDGCH